MGNDINTPNFRIATKYRVLDLKFATFLPHASTLLKDSPCEYFATVNADFITQLFACCFDRFLTTYQNFLKSSLMAKPSYLAVREQSFHTTMTFTNFTLYPIWETTI